MTVPDFMIWRCAGCGAPAEGTKKPCDCATNVGCRSGPNGTREQIWWDALPIAPAPLSPEDILSEVDRFIEPAAMTTAQAIEWLDWFIIELESRREALRGERLNEAS